MAKPQWDSSEYLKFGRERTQPSIDLAVRVAEVGFSSERDGKKSRIIDIGCGPGNSTSVLAATFPGASILGVDNSEDMLVRARTECPQQEFSLFDASGDDAAYEAFSAEHGMFDLVFSNACIQWIPDHPALLARMLGLLGEGGMLAIQVPVHKDEPIYHIIEEMATDSAWAPNFSEPEVFHTLEPDEYFDLLAKLASNFTMWQVVYYHRLASHEAIMDWYRATQLRPYLEALDEDGKAAYEAEMLSEVKKRYPVQQNGEIMFRVPRLFFIARK